MTNYEKQAELILVNHNIKALASILKELDEYRKESCDYCGASLWAEDANGVMHRSCPDRPWCGCGRGEIIGSCSVCDYHD